jgi:hypothetical protein
METKKYTNENNNGDPKNKDDELCCDVYLQELRLEMLK